MTPCHRDADLTAHFHTFGCKLNFAETSTVARIFADHGIRRVHAGDVPDFVVINSCSVTETADRKCRQAIRSFARRWPDARIVVTGCYAQLKPGEVATLPGVVVVAGNDRKLLLADYLEEILSGERTRLSEVIPAKEISTFSPSCSRGDRTRYFQKVQDGCDYYCSYCTIPMARGRSRSASIESLVDQARQAAAEGGKEIVVTGVNIGDFGKGTDKTFFDLIRALDEVNGIERYRISSIEPNLLSDEIIEFVASSKRFMPHFHIPLQCGDDDVLKLMRRHYDTELFARRIESIKKHMPDAFIGVDLIVGARGETDERFENSRRFVERLPITRLHVFPYSERPNTRALTIDHVVDQEEKHRRARIMINLSERKLNEFSSRYIGTVRPLLLEHTVHHGTMCGFTDNYLKVRIKAISEKANTIIPVRINGCEGEEMEGEPAI